ncbi:MAG: plasmid pRiA4b ORF-3 family protein [Lachnospiraceae bacterium]|nr:plasmid pRiA4b ORF-3 family protein [Lachnospiraceae bacterium]MDE7030755.1 plasmid pRiA4b ORF-3 family protein [Lachnospiraceae bacterium]
MAEKIKGKCKYCAKEYTYGYMGRHLAACGGQQSQPAAGKKKCGYFELAISPRYDKDHWLFIEIKESATLQDLDQFLRDIWLECCGHLSAFDIDGVTYDVEPDDDDFWDEPSEDMNHKLSRVLQKGMTFRYEYDFGDTTELIITVRDHIKKAVVKDDLTILSRNNPHVYICKECGKKPAVVICQECYYESGDGFLCEDCSRTHACGEEMQINVCNSPRMGVCAYQGSARYPDQFEPDVPAK